jgi:PIN domain nuclease of toxin-antitoxin system
VTSLAIDEDAVLHISRLPSLHRDPFDRMLVSQAIVHGMAILTPDPLIVNTPLGLFGNPDP